MTADIVSRIRAVGVLPVIVIDDAGNAVHLAEALAEGGLPAVEITFRTAAAANSIVVIKRAMPNVLVGAGTVLSPAMAEAAKEAGADFALAPGTNPIVIAAARENGLPFYPGICTPSEIEQALVEGVSVMKFFPAEAEGGLAKLKTIASPYGAEGLLFIPTGGIRVEGVAAYLKSDLILAVGGTWIASQELIAQRRWDTIRQNAAEAVAAVRAARPT